MRTLGKRAACQGHGRLAGVAAAVLCALAVGGLSARLAAASEPPADAAPGIYARATNYLDLAVLFKPRTTNEEDLSFKLAPFIFQETTSASAASHNADAFARIVLTNGTVSLDRTRAAVYFAASTPLVNGRPHAQLTFVWFYESGSAHSKSPIPAQAIRLTLDSSGEPVIWEILADNSGRELIFVSQKVESAAAAEFGAVLPGRRHAIERGTNEAAQVIVPRVIDDAPVPMGPMVYLTREARSAAAVSCRCMPVQARKLARTEVYDLLPIESLGGWPFLHQAYGPGLNSWAVWPGGSAPTKLEQRLRLPGTF